MNVLKLKLLGGAAIQWGSSGKEIEFSTRKAKALVIFLAMAPNMRVTRSKLADLLWERSAEEQARASLRQTLANVRKALTVNDQCLLETSSEEIYLQANSVDVDALRFDEQQQGQDVKSTEDTVALYRGVFLDGFSIHADQFEAWIREKRKHYSELAIQNMTSLSEYWNSSGDLDKSINILKKILSVDPLHEASHRRLMHLYTLIGRRESAIKQYIECKQLLEDELSIEPQNETIELYEKIIHKEPLFSSAKPYASSAPRLQDAEKEKEINDIPQDLRYCYTEDGVRLAYTISGTGSPIVKTGNWRSPLELHRHTPLFRHLLRALEKDHTLVRYDARGTGLSDWEVDEISMDAFVKDLETVANASDFKKFALYGATQGAAVSIAYAVRHPKRVSHLIIYGGWAVGWKHLGKEWIEKYEAFLTLVEQGWGQDNPTFRQMFTSTFMPDGTYEQMQWFNELQRVSTSPKNAARHLEANGEYDIRDLLHKVTVPTLVMHCKDDAVLPFSWASKLAQGIPHAKFVPLEGRNHLILEQEPAWNQFLAAFEAFLSKK